MPKEPEEKAEIEIPETPAAPEPVSNPTEAQAKESGLSSKEIAAAKEHGLLAKEGDADAGDKGDDKAIEDAPGVKPGDDPQDSQTTGKKGEPDAKEKEEEGQERSGQLLEQDLDPQAEHEALSKFNKNEKALYFRLKKEKVKRQSSESDRDHTLIKLKAKEQEAEALKEKLAAFEARKPKESDEDDLGLEDEEKPAEEKPLTEKDLDAREKRKQEEADKERGVRNERARKLNDAHKLLELDAKARYNDFDSVAELANDIVKADTEGRLNEIFPDPRTSSRIHRKVQELLTGLVRADEFKDGEYNPADIAYELGISHPKHGKPATNGKSGKDQDLTPEDVDKLARRRTSSAALTGGGGKRVVSYDDLSLEDLASLPSEKFRQVPKHIRDKVLHKNA